MEKRLEEICTPFKSDILVNKITDNNGDYPLWGAKGLVKNIDYYIQDIPYISVIKWGAGVGRADVRPAFSSMVATMQGIIPAPNIDIDWLCYLLRSMHLEQYATNAVIPNLYYKDYCKTMVSVPSIERQKEITFVLKKIEGIIDARQQELQKLDELVKARFVEMFGDKSKYKVEPLNDNVEEMFIGPFGSALKNEYFVDEDDSYCMVYEQKHAIQKTMDLPTRYVDEKKYNELKRFTVLGGDIIVSCRGTIGEIYSIPEDAPMGIMHPSIMKIRLKKEKYCNLFFVLMLEQYMQDSISKAKGSGVKMAVTATELGKELFVVPDIEEQIAFERFVKQLDKSKAVVKEALEEANLLLDSLGKKYFE